MPTLERGAVHRVAVTLGMWIVGAVPLASAEANASMTLEETRQLTLDELGVMDSHELALRREVCINGNIDRVLGRLTAELERGAVPTAADYCSAALRAAVRQGSTLRLFENLALQQLGLGNELAFPEQKRKLGNKPFALVANIRAAADGGHVSFIDAAGAERPLSCPLALEAGAAWAADQSDQVVRTGITDELAGKIVGVCFNPDITEVNISATGQKLTVQQAGVAAGEVLAKRTKS